METISSLLAEKLRAALPDGVDASPQVTVATDARFGDYQTNVAMMLAKQLRANPRQVAQQIIDRLDVAGLCAPPEIAGAGFINFRLKPAWIEQRLIQLASDARLGVPVPAVAKQMVIDFSGPNVAKPMHVGHIRSTILGDALARIAEFIGHRVVRDNHIGDWGTQFGMLLVGWKHLRVPGSLRRDPIAEMERIYKYMNLLCDLPGRSPRVVIDVLGDINSSSNPAFEEWSRIRRLADGGVEVELPKTWDESDFSIGGPNPIRAVLAVLKKSGMLRLHSPFPIHRQRLGRLTKALEVAGRLQAQYRIGIREIAKKELVKLQAGDAENLEIWREMIRLSKAQFDMIYSQLGVRFDEVLGESFYNPRLQGLVQELRDRGIATESEGALCVFSDGAGQPEDDPFLIKDKEGWRPNPALVQKSDGASNYTTTDLATLEYRMKTWSPDEIAYVTDGRQQLHFRQLFAIFRRWQPDLARKVRLAHVWFGSILGEDGRPFKTRSGETVKLAELLDEAEERALKLVTEKNPELPENDRREIARVVGLGAIKYADLLPNRQSDYVFSWDKMLSFQGNTAPYLQNAYMRVRAIFRKAEDSEARNHESRVRLAEPAELILAKKLLQFGEVLPQVLDDFRPNLLANYLFELATTYHSFYEACPVLRAEAATRESRLLLCEVTARMLKQGLALLGIEAPERM